MEDFPVTNSSNISKISYEQSSMTLIVEFHNGNAYEYYDVPEAIWQQFKAAPSAGEFLNSSVKGQYRYSKV